MNIVSGSIWDLQDKSVLIGIPTNGVVRTNGKAVMGAGVAEQAVERFSGIDRILGEKLQKNGNHVYPLTRSPNGAWIASFPTKDHFSEESIYSLVQQSAREFNDLYQRMDPDGPAVLPEVGCGRGGMDFEQTVRPLLEEEITIPLLVVQYDSDQTISFEESVQMNR